MGAALDAGDITSISIWTIIIVVAVGVLLSLLLTALIARIIILVAVLAVAGYVWLRHNQIEDAVDQHKCSFTFAGIHLDAPASLRRYCG